MKKFLTLTAFTPLLFVACTRWGGNSANVETGRTPEETVKQFVELSASAKETDDKRRLEELTAGELRRAFSQMSDESFRMTYLNHAIKIKDLKILESVKEGAAAKVSYSVSVENPQGTDITHETNEREVLLTQSQGAWYIESLRPKGSDRIAFTKGMIF